MLNELTQEDVTEYATNALTIDEPRGTDYTQGVQVGKTIPAKWWNWLFRAATKRLQEAKSDATKLFAELKNTVTDAGITPDPTDNTQMSQAAGIIAVRGVTNYVEERKRGFFSKWTTEECTGIPHFSGDDTVTVEELKPIPNSDNRAFYLRLHQHTSDPVGDNYLHYTSTDLVNWHEITAPNGAELQSVDIIYFKGRYFFLYSVKNVYNAQLYYSDDAVSWYFSRSFSEYGALGLRIAANVLWMISASALTYSNVNYHSFRTSDGVTWTDAGTIFRNASGIEDAVGEVASFQGSYIIGNKITSDGVNWSVIISDWANSAYSKTIVTGTGVALVQFNATEGAWYTIDSPVSPAVKRLGTWLLGFMGPEDKILAKDSADDYAGITTDGINFTKLTIAYPTQSGAEFFRCNDEYILGAYKSSDLTTWEAITLPLGATVPQYSGVGFYIIAGNFFSVDNGANWVQGEAAGAAFCAVPVYVSDTATCMTVVVNDGIALRCMTFNGVNRVIGTTLYLK